MAISALWVMATAALMSTMVAVAAAQLQVHFYKDSCPQAELVVRSIMQQRFSSDPSLPAGLLRLHFHDCFVHVTPLSLSLSQKIHFLSMISKNYFLHV